MKARNSFSKNLARCRVLMELPHEQPNCHGIAEKHAGLFDVSEKAWAVALQFGKEGDVIGRGNPEAVNFCVAAVLAKQMRAFYTVVLLCRKGLGNEAEQIRLMPGYCG